MQILQRITVLELIRSVLSGVGRTRAWGHAAGQIRSNRIDAEAMPEHLKQDLGLTDTHHRRHPPRRAQSAFDAVRGAVLQRPF